MRPLLKACGIGAIAYLGLLVSLFVVLTVVPRDTPLSSGISYILGAVAWPLGLFLTADFGQHVDLLLAIFAVGALSAGFGALAGGCFWVLIHGFLNRGHRTKPGLIVLALANRDTQQESSGDRAL